MARRSKTTWVFLSLVLGGVAFGVVRGLRSPKEPGALAGGAASGSAASSAGAPLFPDDGYGADPATLPLLGGLQLESPVAGGFRIVGVRPPRDGRIAVNLQRGSAVSMTVWIERKKPGGHPAFETASYALTFGNVYPDGLAVPEGKEIAQLVKERVAAVEGKVTAPPGL